MAEVTQLSPRLQLVSTIGLLSLCIVAVFFLLFLMAKIPFGGAYTVTYLTLSKIKWAIGGIFSFLLFCKWMDIAGEAQRRRALKIP
jgi:hypothetical protein